MEYQIALPASTFTRIFCRLAFLDRTVPQAYGDSPRSYKDSDSLQHSSYAVKSGWMKLFVWYSVHTHTNIYIYIYIYLYILCFVHRRMKFLVFCLLLSAGTCLGGVYNSNTYSNFYNSLPDDCKYFIILPVDGRPACKMCQYSVAGWLIMQCCGSHFTYFFDRF